MNLIYYLKLDVHNDSIAIPPKNFSRRTAALYSFAALPKVFSTA